MNMPFSQGGPNFNGNIMGPQSQTYSGGLGALAYGAQHSNMPVPTPVAPGGTKADTAGIEAAKQKMAGVRERYSNSPLVRDVKRELAPNLEKNANLRRILMQLFKPGKLNQASRVLGRAQKGYADAFTQLGDAHSRNKALSSGVAETAPGVADAGWKGAPLHHAIIGDTLGGNEKLLAKLRKSVPIREKRLARLLQAFPGSRPGVGGVGTSDLHGDRWIGAEIGKDVHKGVLGPNRYDTTRSVLPRPGVPKLIPGGPSPRQAAPLGLLSPDGHLSDWRHAPDSMGEMRAVLEGGRASERLNPLGTKTWLTMGEGAPKSIEEKVRKRLKTGSDGIFNLASSLAKSAQEPTKPPNDGMTYSGGSAFIPGVLHKGPVPKPTSYQGKTTSQLPAGAPNSPTSPSAFRSKLLGAGGANELQRRRDALKSKAEQLPEGLPGQTRSGTFSQGQLVTRHPDVPGPSGASHAGPPGTSHPLAGTRPLNERGQDPDNLEQYHMDNPATRPGPASGRMPNSEMMGQPDWQASQRIQQPQTPVQTATTQAKPINSGPDPAKLEQYYLDNPAARPKTPPTGMPSKSIQGGSVTSPDAARFLPDKPQTPVQTATTQAKPLNSGPDPAKLEEYYKRNPAARPKTPQPPPASGGGSWWGGIKDFFGRMGGAGHPGQGGFYGHSGGARP